MSTRRPELGKWLLYKWFYRSPSFRAHLPDTRLYSDANLRDMLQRHQSVYVKPVAGSRGSLVTKVTRRDGQSFTVHTENRAPLTVDGFASLHEHLKRHRAGRQFIVQRDVRLATIAGRPFDIRVMMQKDASRRWQCTGICAKVAGPHSAVTNIARSRGRVLSLSDALKQSLGYGKTRCAEIESTLRELGYKTCARLEEYQPYSEIGVDLGVSDDGQVWILEQNTGPSHALFAHLQDKQAWHLIRQTAMQRRLARGRRS
ncbi:MAG: YheC/YheD family protein [Firmicutes bacterium]|nr:YheC/YheD family protein [Bacillota bacterium]